MKRITLIWLICLLCGCLFAQERSKNEAVQIAKKFWKDNVSASSLSFASQDEVQTQINRKVRGTRRSPARKSGYYIINDEENKRFLVVSADERMHEILGYSYSETFDSDNIPDGLLYMLDIYDREYDEVQTGNVEVKPLLQKAPRQKIAPLIKTKWGQGSPYSNYCPIDNGIHSVTGCVATAMAQVMNYWKYPDHGEGSDSYKTDRRKFEQSMDFSNIYFEWNNMINDYKSATNAQKKAVAQLMHACGVSVRMDYTSGESSAYPYDIAYALINNFKYNPNLKFYYKNFFSEEEWENIVYDNLEKKLPIMYVGYGVDEKGKTYGHCFILDGSDGQGFFHFNWGWNGNYDGEYFRLSSLTPGKYNFNSSQSMVCDISPQQMGKHEDVFFAESLDLPDNATIGTSSSCLLKRFCCYTSSSNSYNVMFVGEIGVGLFDLNFNYIKPLYKKQISLLSCWGYSEGSFPFVFDSSTFTENSQYYIAAYAKGKDSVKPTIIRTTNGSTDYYLVEVKNGIVKVTPKGVPSIEPTEGTYKVTALDRTGNVVEWNAALIKDGSDNQKYWILNIDPAASTMGCKNSENKVYGYINNRNEIRIPTNQKIGDNLLLNNFSSADNITVHLSADKTMTIGDVWGLVAFEKRGTEETRTTYSQYTSAQFRYDTPLDNKIQTPIIVVNDQKTMSISCQTIGADIYYTYSPEGTTPSKNSTLYRKPIQLKENGIIKAIAIKDGKSSAIAIEEVSAFEVATPVITSPSNNMIAITCATDNAVIYYTTNGETPSVANWKKYTSAFKCGVTTMINAIAVRKNWRDSPVASYEHVAITEFIIANNVAGKISSKLTEENKMTATKLTISGKLNGTDIKYLREMMIDGNLSHLDISNADIISGGEAYYTSGSTNVYTEDNYVDDYMFWRMSNLKSLELPKSTKRIGGIRGCDNLTKIIVPEGCLSVERIEGDKMEYIYIPKSVTKIDLWLGAIGPSFTGFEVHPSNSSYKSVEGALYTKDGVLMKCPEKKSGPFVVPEGTKAISSYACANSNIRSIELPSTVATIGSNAFEDCKELEEVKMSRNTKVSKIDRETFKGCQSLKSIFIGAFVTSIASKAFDGTLSFQNFEVHPDNTTYASLEGVLYTKDMKTLIQYPVGKYSELFHIPNGVEIIGDNAFRNCINIKGLHFPSTVTTIRERAFQGCSMENINLPESVEKIYGFAFSGCSELQSLILPKNISFLGNSAITNCPKLSYVYLPYSIETLIYGNISNCPSLKVINSDIKEIDKVVVQPMPHEGVIEYYAMGIFDNPHNIYMGLLDNPTEPSPCKFLVPFGCSEDYKKTYWWRSIYSIEEKTQNGDSNNDGAVSVADITEMVDYVLNRPSDKFIFDVSDLNKDGEIDVTDISLSVPLVMDSDNLRRKSIPQENDDYISVNKNGKDYVSISLKNTSGYIASQFDIVTSLGQVVENVKLNKGRCNNHQLSWEKIDEDRYRVVIFSLGNGSYNGGIGDLVTVESNNGVGNVKLENIEFVTIDRDVCTFGNNKNESTNIYKVDHSSSFDIHSIDGVLLRKNATTTKGLSKGVYIINGKKVIVK